MTAIEVRHAASIVVGSGIAGLTVALAHGDCVVVSKTALGDGSSRWAQGGIAAAIGPDDDPLLHAADTQEVSGGLGRADIAELVTVAAPERIDWLISLGAEFDTAADGSLTLGREAGHDQRRIVHANGDATGAEVMRTLVRATVERSDIERLDDTFVIDLLRDGDRVVGVLAGRRSPSARRRDRLPVCRAGNRRHRSSLPPHDQPARGDRRRPRDGGPGRRRHQRPRVRAVPPHRPRTGRSTRCRCSPRRSAARERSWSTAQGHRYMRDVHPDAELAPRDVVARENWRQRQNGPIHLDARVIGPDFPERFPTVWRIAQQAGLDPRVDLLPVSPAEHYHMGGIATDDVGRSSIPGLYACGEAASTGLHGANRLASNSLLEGLVFGARVAETMLADTDGSTPSRRAAVPRTALHLDHDTEPQPRASSSCAARCGTTSAWCATPTASPVPPPPSPSWPLASPHHRGPQPRRRRPPRRPTPLSPAPSHAAATTAATIPRAGTAAAHTIVDTVPAPSVVRSISIASPRGPSA